MKTFSKSLSLAILVSVLGLALGTIAQERQVVRIVTSDKASRGPWLGVYLKDTTPKLAQKESLKAEEGAYVSNVMKKSPADSAGIQKGDVIVEFNGRKIYDADDLVKTVRRLEVGAKAKVVLMRKADRKELFVTLSKYPKREARHYSFPHEFGRRMMIFKGKGMIGLTLSELNPQLAKYFDAPEGQGVLVERVEEGSVAEKAGLKAGDVILKVGDRVMDDVRDVRRQIVKYKEGEKAPVEILRKGSRMTLNLQIEESEAPGERDFFLGDLLPPRHGEDFDLELFGPEDGGLFELEVPNFEPQMQRLRIDLDKMRERLMEDKERLKNEIRQGLEKIKVRMET